MYEQGDTSSKLSYKFLKNMKHVSRENMSKHQYKINCIFENVYFYVCNFLSINFMLYTLTYYFLQGSTR